MLLINKGFIIYILVFLYSKERAYIIKYKDLRLKLKLCISIFELLPDVVILIVKDFYFAYYIKLRLI